MTSSSGAKSKRSKISKVTFSYRQIWIDYYVVSAKTGEGIIDTFIDLGNRMMSIQDGKSKDNQMSFIQGYRTETITNKKLRRQNTFNKAGKSGSKCC